MKIGDRVRIVKDYSGTNLHKTHNDEYYTSRVYEF